ncbi:hypothetical protein MIND_00394600 [Mycena indigotica]|uniref:F-box domain-containing protein n=1 Tax=Mycena indigotica TaxID=2126181 RepID=A0A8H6WF65_9AGAR|nr:uncharacterized protein MIND_00394600 [Mycena indigotica]KAF7310209.1 hypothetical protein MIND_00394600 [Mycena indigotica]
MSGPSKRAKTVSTNENASPASPGASTAQKQCLQNIDLLEMILRANYDPSLRPSRVSLLSVGLACKSFTPTAVRLLWEQIPSLVPLMRLLRNFSLNEDIMLWELNGIIRDADWQLFDRYAAYVRVVDYTYSSSSSMPVQGAVYLRLAMRKQPLLPNLQRLVFTGMTSKPYNDGELLLYLSPSINSLTLASGYTSTAQTFLELLAQQSPHIEKLSLSGARELVGLDAVFKGLRTLDLKTIREPLTTADLQVVGGIPDLRVFSTDLVMWDAIQFELIPHDTLFLSLSELNVKSTRKAMYRIVPAFLLTIGAPALKRLDVLLSRDSYQDRVDTSQHPAAFRTLGSRLVSRWATSLEYLSLNGMSLHSIDDFPFISGLTSLRTLHLHRLLTQGTSLSDGNVLTVVRTWPVLETLTFAEGHGDADIAFFQALAEHCPALRVLHVPFTPTRNMVPEIPRGGAPPKAHGLRELRLSAAHSASGYSWDGVDLHLLARHLDRMFKDLVVIQGEEYRGRWSEVGKLVMMCQEVRQTTWAA